MDSANKNVTLRKHKSMLNINSSIESTQSEDLLGRSLDLSTTIQNKYCFEEMREEIKQLKSSLESTQNELDTISLENSDLRKQINSLSQEMAILKQICTSPLSSFKKNMCSSLTKGTRRRLVNSFCNSPMTATLFKSDSQASQDGNEKSQPILTLNQPVNHTTQPEDEEDEFPSFISNSQPHRSYQSLQTNERKTLEEVDALMPQWKMN